MELAGMILQGSHEPSLVLLSIVIAVAAAYAALDLAGRATAARGRVRVAWIIGGAVAMGIGINAMHFVGMLGYHLPFAVLYDVPTVLASLLAAIIASCVALFVVSRPEMRPGDALIGSLFMGAGIVTMHYTGMSAMRLAADAQYDPLLVALSVVVAISVSLVGLWLVFYLRDPSARTWWRRVGGAVVVGLAIPSMHYVAMAAVQYTPVAELPDVSHAIQISSLGAVLIGVATLVILSLAVLTSVVDRRLEAKATALVESEERFRAVAETASDAIVSADKRGHITYFNPGAERIFGYAARDVIGSPLTLLMPKRFHDAHRQGLARFLSTGKAHVIGRTVELVGRRKDGTEFPLELSLASWKAGGETYFTGILRDITERKQAEEEVKKFNEQLEAANKELDAFSYSVAHDLRAPLRAIDGFSRILLEDHVAHLPADAQRYLHAVRNNSQRMGRLIDDLLTFARLSRQPLRLQLVRPADLARQCGDELHAEQQDRRVEIAISDLPACQADPALLKQVWLNLISNALKYTRKQEMAVIAVGCQEQDGATAYFVGDNGVGFDMRYADKLFGVFQRLHRSEEYAGTGVGLAIVQRIIHRHGGRVWAEAAVDHGATFYFTLQGAAPNA